MKVELLFVDRTRAANPIGVQAALQLDECTNVLAIVNVEIEHVSFIEVSVHVGLLSPAVVSDLLPDLSGFSSNRHEPVIDSAAKPDVFDRVPKFLTQGRVPQETPIFVFPQ